MRVCRAAVAIIAVTITMALAAPVFAAADGSGYGRWTVSGGSGTLTVPLAGFPSATVTTNSSRTQVAGGTSAFLGSSTPFGAAYGTSQGHQYLVAGTAIAATPSTTTVAFSATPPVGWGFALGDVDADTVRVTATGTGGQPVSTADLGWQSAFNYCRQTPRPTSCTGTSTDLPRWDPATATLIGNVADTSGASGWFRPAVPIRSLTLTFTAQSGTPSYQVWVAALPVSIAGRVTTDCGRPAPRAAVRLLDADGSPVLDADGHPISTTSAADGAYSFAHLVPGRYEVAVDPTQGYTGARHTVQADTDVSGANLVLTCPAPPTTQRPTPPPPTTVDVQPGTPVTITLPDGMVATHVDEPAHGTATVDPGGTITYVPDTGFTGTDHIRYTARTRSGAVVTGTITVRVVLAATGRMVVPVAALGGALVMVGVAVLIGFRRRPERR
jgi:hypothetical protein